MVIYRLLQQMKILQMKKKKDLKNGLPIMGV